MRDVNVYNFRRALPRMSWDPRNLYNLWRRSLGPLKSEGEWKYTEFTVFKQRWIAKRLVRAYHGDFINEKIFKRWYLPATLPDVRPRKIGATSSAKESVALANFAKKFSTAEGLAKHQEEEDSKGLAPVGSLMFGEVERRIDVVIFRACLAHSVYEARRFVIHGNVLLNGKKHTDANTRLAPGDMVSVDPAAIRFLQAKSAPDASKEAAESPESSVAPDAEASEGEEVTGEATSTEPTAEDEGGAKDSPEALSESKRSKSSKPRVDKTSKWARNDNLTPFHPPPYSAPFMFIPAYIEVSFPTCSAIYLRHPTARPGYSEIPTPYDADGEVVRLAWEWYSRTRPRIRSKSQLARMPENRQ